MNPLHPAGNQEQLCMGEFGLSEAKKTNGTSRAGRGQDRRDSLPLSGEEGSCMRRKSPDFPQRAANPPALGGGSPRPCSLAHN